MLQFKTNHFCVVVFSFSFVYILYLLNWFLQEIGYSLGSVNDLHWGFDPALRYIKPHSLSTFIGEGNETEMYLFYQGHLNQLTTFDVVDVVCIIRPVFHLYVNLKREREARTWKIKQTIFYWMYSKSAWARRERETRIYDMWPWNASVKPIATCSDFSRSRTAFTGEEQK